MRPMPADREDSRAKPREDDETLRLVDVQSLKSEDYDGSCLRPLGLCDLGSCDVCWYRPDHPRFKKD